MKTLYIDCAMGAAGDMLLSALTELMPEPDAFVNELNALAIPGLSITRELRESHGVAGSHLAVRIDGAEEGEKRFFFFRRHRKLKDVYAVLDGLSIPAAAKEDAKAVYAAIAGAEGKAHGKSSELVHFHEVGALDAIADVAGVSLAMEKLGAERVVASPVHVGAGTVRCAHGVLPVPAPATAALLEGIPTYGGQVQGELCTPTGAALLRHFADGFGDMPEMENARCGIGLGSKDFGRPNALRCWLGETAETAGPNGEATELRCNLDDMTPEALAFACERLEEAGALDVSVQPLLMKKGRAGQLLTVLCHREDADRLASLILCHTSAIGLRRFDCTRYTLRRELVTVDTPLGPIRLKRSEGYGVKKEKYEYEDIAAAARERGLSFAEAEAQIQGLR
ncbi:MAG: nickel pincer cofactor biosynthesis protein LarC [Oscillospiraceae bacterium]|nr:nickel pincer cofactor biosynthesis protein LarC [Oscillospiraceae bacterium]